MSLADQFAQDVASPTQAAATPTQAAPAPLASQFLAESNPAFFTVPDSNPVSGNSFLENSRIGAGKAFSDIGHGLTQRAAEIVNWEDKNLPGQQLRHTIGNALDIGTPQDWQNAVQQNVDEHKVLDVPISQTGGGKAGNIVGNVALAAPAMFIPGGQTLAGSMLTGAALGAAEPTATGESVAKNAAMGGAGGALGYGTAKYAVPTAVSAAKGLFRGADAKAGAQILQSAGSDAAAQEALDALRNSSPLVPGSLPTVAQASQNPGIAALQRTVSQTNPSEITAYAERAADQNAARVAALNEVAGSDGARDFYAASRSQAAKDLYGDAFKQGADPAAMTPWLKGQVTQLMKRPSIQAAMGQAKNLAAEDGIQLNDATSLQGLHYAKMALDDQIAQSARAGTDVLTNKLMGTKDMLLGVMDKMSPAYAEARTTFQQMSKPINQIDVAQAIADKSIKSLDGTLQPNAFARALSDATARRATGFNGATLENTMEPQQLQTLNAIRDDLASSVFAQNAGRGSGSDTMQKSAISAALSNLGNNLLSYAKRLPGSGVIFDNWNKVGSAQKAAIAQKLSESLLDPQQTANLMEQAMKFSPNYGTAGIINSAIKRSAPATGIIGGAVLARPTTAVANGPQQ